MTFTCPTCGTEVSIDDIQPQILPAKNGWLARDPNRRLAAFGSSQELAVANLKGAVGSYERSLARYRVQVHGKALKELAGK